MASRYVGTDLDRLEQIGMIRHQKPDCPSGISRLDTARRLAEQRGTTGDE